MRRPIPVSRQTGNAAWHKTQWVPYSGSTVVDPSRACGDFVERREVTCRKGNAQVDEYFCSSEPKPASEQPVRLDGGCTYSWNATGWVDPGASCSLKERQTRTVSCLRDSDKAPMAESFCTGTKPASEQEVQDFSTCTYSWDNGEYVDKGASCSAAEVLERDVWCKRDLDGARMTDAALCDPSKRPEGSTTQRDESSCTYRWDAPAEFTDPGESCTRSETHTRPVTCVISLDGSPVADARCAGIAKPDATLVVPDYSKCDYKAVEPSDWTWSSTCSATATKTRTFKCQRSNDGGEIVADSECQSRGIGVTEDVVEANYSSCSNSWKGTGLVDPGSNCGNETWTQDVSCRRDLDQQLMPETSCTGTKPPSSEVRYDTSSCGYSVGNWGPWTYASACSAMTTKSRRGECIRSDGQVVPDAECQSRGKGVTEDVSEANYAGCSYEWVYTDYVGAGCGQTEQTRTASCRRTLDGATVDASLCAGKAKEPLSRTVADYGTCTYGYGAWSAESWSSQCSANATWTQTRSCVRSDGTTVDAAECRSRGKGEPTQSGQRANYAQCSHHWSYSGFSGAGCGATTQTQTATCVRDLDGATVGDAACSGVARDPLTRSVTNYDACGYDYGAWSARSWNTQCSSAATWTESRTCVRSDGTPVGAAECQSRGKGDPTRSGTAENYDGCAHQWSYSAFAGAGCGQTTQTRTAWCSRMPSGATVADSFCSGSAKDALTRSVTNYDACGFDYGSWSARSWDSQCSSSANWSQSRTCYRSDGTPVAAAECQNRGKGAPTQGGTEANYSQCSYTPSSTQSACSGGSMTVTNSCRRGDGQMVANSFCGQPDSSTQSCTSYGWAAGGYGGFGACQTDSRQYQYRDVYCQSNNGGNLGRVDDSLCGGGKPTNVNSQACTYAGWQQAGWGSYTSSCGPATRYMNYSCVRSSDGAVLPDAECTNRYGAKPVVKDSDVYNTSGCTYTTNYGGWGACQNGTQYRTNTCTRNQTGESVDTQTYCGVPSTQSQGCQMPTPVVNEATFGNADGYDSYSGAFNRPGDNPPTHVRVANGIDLGPGNGNYNYEGMSCSYSVTFSYNGQSATVGGSGATGASGGCTNNPSTVTVGGRSFTVTSSWSSNGYGTANHTFRIF